MMAQFDDAPAWVDSETADSGAYRRALSAFATGVTVVATRDRAGQVRSFTANSFSSVSLDPPLILVCQKKASPAAPVFARSAHFSVNVLTDAQKALSIACASREPQLKASAQKDFSEEAVPVVQDSLASFVCALHQVVDAGDHNILLGRVLRFRKGPGEPLGFFAGRYATLTEMPHSH